jgi:membrane-bound inhibitor of C-type lysozyme
MNWRKTIILAAAMSASGTLAAVPRATAQSFQTYRCADGTHFIVAFYPHDTRAYMQIDGRPVTLARRRLVLSGSRYSGGGVTLKITKAGTTVRRARRPVTACELA